MRNRESEGHADSDVEDSARAPLLSRRTAGAQNLSTEVTEVDSCAYSARAQHELLCSDLPAAPWMPSGRGTEAGRGPAEIKILAIFAAIRAPIAQQRYAVLGGGLP